MWAVKQCKTYLWWFLTSLSEFVIFLHVIDFCLQHSMMVKQSAVKLRHPCNKHENTVTHFCGGIGKVWMPLIGYITIRYKRKQRNLLRVGLETSDKKLLSIKHNSTEYSGVNRAMLRTKVKGDGPIYTPYTLQLKQAKPPLIPQKYIIDKQSLDRIA